MIAAECPCYSNQSLLESLYARTGEIQNTIRVAGVTFIFTVGSRSELGTGSATYVSAGNFDRSCLREPYSVFAVELNAICEACKIDHHDEGDFMVASDSMSSILALKNQHLLACSTCSNIWSNNSDYATETSQ